MIGDSSRPTSPLMMPPRPGYCHAARCDEPTRFVVRIRRLNGAWTSGVDYCEQHAHEVARRMRDETLKVVVEPIYSDQQGQS